MEQKFVANKAVIVDQKGRILVLRDAGLDDHAVVKDEIDFPGGRMNHGETPIEGLFREVYEEIGVQQEQLEYVGPFHVGLWGFGGDIENKPIVGIFYLLKAKSDLKITLSPEHSEFIWVNPQLPLSEEMTMDVEDIIEAYRQRVGISVGVDERIKGREGYGLIQVFTGNGKGKTTAALGEAIRACGVKKKVGIVYFDKGGVSHYSERHILSQIDGIAFVATGRDRIDANTGQFDFSVSNEDVQEAQRGLKAAEQMFDEGYDLVVLDEINSTTSLGMLPLEDVLNLLDSKPDNVEVILTGRNAPKEVLDRAHLITNMQLNRHYFYSGVPAREGLDF